MRKQDIPENLPDCKADKDDCICGQLLDCQPGEIIKIRGNFNSANHPCILRFTKTLINSQGFQWKSWPEPRPHDKEEKLDKMFDEDFIVAALLWGLDKGLKTGVINNRQHFFISHIVEKIVPFYVEVYLQGKNVGYEFASEDSFMSKEEFEGLTGMGDIK